jgi:hypothetical protein
MEVFEKVYHSKTASLVIADLIVGLNNLDVGALRQVHIVWNLEYLNMVVNIRYEKKRL